MMQAYLKKQFKEHDKDNNGYITFEELRTVMYKINEGLTDDIIEDLIKDADKNADGKINFEGNLNK